MKTTNSLSGWLHRTILILLTLALTGSFASAQDRHRIEQVSSLYDYWSDILDIAVEGNSAYVASGVRGLIVVDITDPQDLEQIGSFQVNNSGMDFVAVANDIAYTIWTGGVLRVLDVSNPLNISELSFFQLQPFWRSSGIIYSEGLLFIGTYTPGFAWQWECPLFIFDVEDPENLELLSAFIPPDDNIEEWGPGRGVGLFDVEGEFVYLMNQHGDLFSLRISDPENPEIVATHEGEGGGFFRAQNQRLYLIGGTEDGPLLKIIDFNGRDQFNEVTEFNLPGIVREIEITGNTFFCSLSTRLLYSFNVANPEDIREIGSIRTQNLETFALEGNRLFGGSNHNRYGLFCIDIADPAEMRVVSELNHHGAANDIARVGDLALLSGYDAGLKFIDVANPEEPRELSVYDRDRFVYNFEILEQRAYVMDTYSIRVVNFEDPANPVEVSVVYDESADAVAISGEYLFTVGNSPGLSVYDMEDPDHPELVVHSWVVGVARSIEAKDDRVFIPDFDGVRVFDVSDPEAGIEELPLIENEANGSPWVKIVGNYLFMGQGSHIGDDNLMRGFLTIIDIEDIERPRVLSRITPRNYGALDVDVAGDMMLVAAGPGGIALYNISNPEEPEEIGWFDTYGTAYGVNLDGAFGYVADYQSLGIYDMSEAIQLSRHPLWLTYPAEEIVVHENDAVLFDMTARGVIDPVPDSFPRGAQMDENGFGNATFFWQTDFSSAGEYLVCFVASSGEVVDTIGIPIIVHNVNRSPAAAHLVTPPDLAGDDDRQYWEDFSLRFRWTSSSDQDDDNLRYHIKLVGSQYGQDHARFDSVCFDAGPDTSILIASDDINRLLDSGWEARWSVWTLDGVDSTRSQEEFRYVHYSGVGDSSFSPRTFHLSPPFPNPFNSSVTISFSVGARHAVPLRLAIYDLSGRLVADLSSAVTAPSVTEGRITPPSPPAVGGGDRGY